MSVTRKEVTEAIQKELHHFMGIYQKDARSINAGWCADFAANVSERLGFPKNLYDYEYANLTGDIGAKEADGTFYEAFLSAHGYRLPEGVTVEKLNASRLGEFGTHVFLALSPELSGGDWRYFDAECPDGVDTPFDLPFAQRFLAALADKREENEEYHAPVLSREEQLENCLRQLVEFTERPEVQAVIDGAFDPSIVVAQAKRLLTPRQATEDELFAIEYALQA